MTWLLRLFNYLLDFVFGYDYFISYAWSDGKSYALKLVSILREQGFAVFIDDDRFETGVRWRPAAARNIRKSDRLIIVGTKAALESQAVDYEIGESYKYKIPITPIKLYRHSPENKFEHLTRSFDKAVIQIVEVTPRVVPSRPCLSKILNTTDLSTQATKRLRIVSGTCIFLAALLVLSVFMFRQARISEQAALENESNVLAALSGSARLEGKNEQAAKLALISFDMQSRMGFKTDRSLTALAEIATEYPNKSAVQVDGGRIVVFEFFLNADVLAFATEDGHVFLWDLMSDNVKLQFKAHDIQLTDIAISENGEFILTSAFERHIKLWDANTGALIRQFDSQASKVSNIEFTGEKNTFVSATVLPILNDDRTQFVAKIWHTDKAGRVEAELSTLTGLQDFAVDPDRDQLALVRDGKISMRSVSSGDIKYTLSDGKNWIYGAAVSANGKYIVSSSSNKLSVWDTKTRQKRRSIPISQDQFSFQISPLDDSVITYSITGKAELWSLPSLNKVMELPNSQGTSGSVTFSPDGELIATYSPLGSDFSLWSARSGRKFTTFEGPGDSLTNMAFSPDGKSFVTGYYNGVVVSWDINLLPNQRFPDSKYQKLFASTVSGDGNYYAVSYTDSFVQTWTSLMLVDVNNKERKQLLPNVSGLIDKIQLNGDGTKLLTVSRDLAITMWNTETKSVINSVKIDALDIDRIILSTTGARALLSSQNGMSWIWNVNTSDKPVQLTLTASAPHTVANLCSCGNRAITVSADFQTHYMWDLDNASVIAKWVTDSIKPFIFAFSKDGKNLYKSNGENEIEVIDAQSGRVDRTFSGVKGDIIAFSEWPERGVLTMTTAEAAVEIRDKKSFSLVHRFDTENPPRNINILLASGKQILTVAILHGLIDLWDVDSGLKTKSLLGAFSGATDIMFSENYKHLTVLGMDRTVTSWELGNLNSTLADQVCNKLASTDLESIKTEYQLQVAGAIC